MVTFGSILEVDSMAGAAGLEGAVIPCRPQCPEGPSLPGGPGRPGGPFGPSQPSWQGRPL